MADFWLDANIYIRPHRDGFYGFPLAPTFWEMLEQKAIAGIIASPRRVYQELADYGDALADWAAARRDTPLFVAPGPAVQAQLTRIADYVRGNYPGRKAAEFLGGADPWVIAHAMADNGVIVSFESRVSIDSQTPKIPNVAQAFQIRTLSRYQMLRLMGVEILFRY